MISLAGRQYHAYVCSNVRCIQRTIINKPNAWVYIRHYIPLTLFLPSRFIVVIDLPRPICSEIESARANQRMVYVYNGSTKFYITLQEC